MFRRTYVAYTLCNGNVCNKNWSLDSAVQFIQQSNKSNNGSTCTTGSTCNTRTVIKTMGIMVACMAATAIFNSAMCLAVAVPAVCLVFMTGVIQSVYAIGLR